MIDHARPPAGHHDLLARLTVARGHRLAGDYAAAAAVLRDAIADAGTTSAEYVVLLNEGGIVGKLAGRFTEAEAAYRRALAVVPGGGAEAAGLLHNLAGLAHARQDAAAALPLAERGLRIRASLRPPDPRGPAADRAALAAILVDLGRHDEARAALDDTLRGGAARYEVAVALHNLGSSQFRRGQTAEAAATLRRSLALKSAELGGRHPDLAVTRYNLGRCLEALGRRRRAVRQWRLAVAVLDGAVAADHPTLLACRRRLATTTGRRRTATAGIFAAGALAVAGLITQVGVPKVAPEPPTASPRPGAVGLPR